LADKIAEFSKEYNGFVHKEDLEDYSPEWVEPMSVDYRGYDIWELPPNGQGVVALMALKILNDMESEGIDNVETIHKQIESIKLAFQKGDKYITDPDFMQIEPKELLADDKIDAMRDKIVDTAIDPERIDPHGSGTVYLATADDEGNMVSHIQSNYMGFGSGLVVPGTGIALQNRGNSFSLDPGHVNSLEPKKRPFHTIIPGFITKNKKPIGPFGVMGGHMQPQGHVQVVSNMIDYDLNPQAALDRPRWLWDSGKKVYLEKSWPDHIGRALSRKGHLIKYALHSGSFGRGQIIMNKKDVYAAGTEPRADGHIASW
ncbi:MAG: gamma-glutamyltransferase family protein, partial [Thermoplasmatota archaeon]